MKHTPPFKLRQLTFDVNFICRYWSVIDTVNWELLKAYAAQRKTR